MLKDLFISATVPLGPVHVYFRRAYENLTPENETDTGMLEAVLLLCAEATRAWCVYSALMHNYIEYGVLRKEDIGAALVVYATMGLVEGLYACAKR